LIEENLTAFQVPENYKPYPGSGNDNTFGSKIRDTIKPGDLILRDIGYFSCEDFWDVEKREAFYISRLKPNIAVYIENTEIEYYRHSKKSKE
jgi:hypothetical protein